MAKHSGKRPSGQPDLEKSPDLDDAALDVVVGGLVDGPRSYKPQRIEIDLEQGAQQAGHLSGTVDDYPAQAQADRSSADDDALSQADSSTRQPK